MTGSKLLLNRLSAASNQKEECEKIGNNSQKANEPALITTALEFRHYLPPLRLIAKQQFPID